MQVALVAPPYLYAIIRIEMQSGLCATVSLRKLVRNEQNCSKNAKKQKCARVAAHDFSQKSPRIIPAAYLREYAIANNAARKFFERGLWVVI